MGDQGLRFLVVAEGIEISKIEEIRPDSSIDISFKDNLSDLHKDLANIMLEKHGFVNVVWRPDPKRTRHFLQRKVPLWASILSCSAFMLVWSLYGRKLEQYSLENLKDTLEKLKENMKVTADIVKLGKEMVTG